MRRDIAGTACDSIPVIMGRYLPYLVDLRKDHKVIDSVKLESPDRLPFVGYANDRQPFLITKNNYSFDNMHFDEAGQAEMGEGHFEAYQKLLK